MNRTDLDKAFSPTPEPFSLGVRQTLRCLPRASSYIRRFRRNHPSNTRVMAANPTRKSPTNHSQLPRCSRGNHRNTTAAPQTTASMAAANQAMRAR